MMPILWKSFNSFQYFFKFNIRNLSSSSFFLRNCMTIREPKFSFYFQPQFSSTFMEILENFDKFNLYRSSLPTLYFK